MPFQLLDIGTIVASMITDLLAQDHTLTDLTEGSVVRSLLEAPAVEIQRLNYSIYQGVREGIEVGTYKNFSFGRLPAIYATGRVTFTRETAESPIVIAQGTRVRVPGSLDRVYGTIEDLTLEIGETSKDVGIRCQSLGTIGNTPSSTIVEFVDTVVGINSVTNTQAVLTGVDQEAEEDRRRRFQLFIAGLSRGTKISIESAALGVYLSDAVGNVLERAMGVLVVEPYLNSADGRLGLVEVYVDNGSGSTSDALLDAVKEVVLSYVAAGISCSFKKVRASTLDVSALVTVAQGFDSETVIDASEIAITTYLRSLSVFGAVIFAELVAAVMNVDGVQDVRFLSPTANVPVLFDQRATPGVIQVAAA